MSETQRTPKVRNDAFQSPPSRSGSTGSNVMLIGGEFVNAGRRPPPKPKGGFNWALVIGVLALVAALAAIALSFLNQPASPAEEEVIATQTALFAPVLVQVGALEGDIDALDNQLALQFEFAATQAAQALNDVKNQIDIEATGAGVAVNARINELETQLAALQTQVASGGDVTLTPDETVEPTTETETEATTDEGDTTEVDQQSVENIENVDPEQVTEATAGERATVIIRNSRVNVRQGPDSDRYSLIATTQLTNEISTIHLDVFGKVSVRGTDMYWFWVEIRKDGEPVPGIRMDPFGTRLNIDRGFVRSDFAPLENPSLLDSIPDIPQELVPTPAPIPTSAPTQTPPPDEGETN